MKPTNTASVYLCLAGHVDNVPSMGMYLGCQVPVEVHGRWAGRAFAPCGCAIVTVPDADGVLQAAYRVGGPQAVLAIVQERVAREGAAAPVGPAR